MVIKGLSIRQIASELLSSKEAVRKGLINCGIPLREPHQPHGRQSQPRYGQKRQNGGVIAFKAEQKVMNAAKGMKKQGLSLRQIAENLSAIGIPTKCNGHKWHPQMVKRILEGNM